MPKTKPPPPPPAAPLPDPVGRAYDPYPIDRPGVWLVLSDLHLPYHDRATIELAVREAKARKAVGVLLNGDVLDSHEVSRHDKDPTAPRYVSEVETAKQFFAYLRGQFGGRAAVAFKAGNHEERLEAYVVQRAPALFGLEGLDLPSLLHLKGYGVEWVADRRVVHLGKLNVLHGHEFPGGVSSPVNPARGLYLKARSVALCGHHHRVSSHGDKDIRQRVQQAWSVGCACQLHPKYLPLNQWQHGFALVEVARDGTFVVDNKQVVDGRVA